MQINTDLDKSLLQASNQFGTPTFVYFTSVIQQRSRQLRHHFDKRFSLSYAVKSNPNPRLLSWMRSQVDLLDVSSIGEFRLALDAGWHPQKLSFTGPGKRDFEIKEAILGGIGELVIESVHQAVVANAIACELGVIQKILIRIAPSRVPKGFGDQMAGRPVAFGIDFEDVHQAMPGILALANLKVTGLHIYSGTQCLNAGAICENYRNFVAIFRDLSETYDLAPDKLVFGSGLGIPYHQGDSALDLEQVADGIVGELDTLRWISRFQNTELVLELGRYLVGEAGYFLTRVISIKHSRGTRIGICDGGINHHLPASGHFGMVIHRNYLMHKVGDYSNLTEKIDLVGPLCTSIDCLARNVDLPSVNAGDCIALHSSGAYGLTASPLHFIGHREPSEVMVEGDVLQDATWLRSYR
ncbi:MAG: diaminopimelate decarboxylase [Cellvibrionaceae bacterium]|jgi:diaminopimelate decarboxylase